MCASRPPLAGRACSSERSPVCLEGMGPVATPLDAVRVLGCRGFAGGSVGGRTWHGECRFALALEPGAPVTMHPLMYFHVHRACRWPRRSCLLQWQTPTL
jgi:hypothetical protein